MVNVGDGNPFPAKLIAQLHSFPKLRLQVFHIGTGQIVNHGALVSQFMRLALKERKEDLAHDGGIGVVHLAEEQVPAHLFVALLGQQAVDHHHLTEGGCCLRQGQRGMERVLGMVGGQHGVDGMAQLVCQREHIVGATLVIEQHPGRQSRVNRPAKGAASLPFAYLTVDVFVSE